MRVGSLFAGIGGFDLGLERAGFEIAWQVEIDDYCQRVLAKHWPHVARYGDIKAINWATLEPVDLMCGGFPCQPFSLAGQRRGTADDRYLWPAMLSGIQQLQPTWIIGENVPGLVGPVLDTVLSDLEAAGYEVQTLAVPACAFDAPHLRQRIWILAHTRRTGQSRRGIRGGQATAREMGNARITDSREALADDSKYGRRSRREGRSDSGGAGEREPSLQTMADSDGTREPQPQRGEQEQRRRASHSGEDVGSSASQGWPIIQGSAEECQCARRGTIDGPSRWEPEPELGRVAHGIPHRVDRLRGLGNAIVPHIAEWIGRQIMKVHG